MDTPIASGDRKALLVLESLVGMYAPRATSLVHGAMIIAERLRDLAELRRDKERLDRLQQLVLEDDLHIAHDEEDGTFIGRPDHDVLHLYELLSGEERTADLRAAIDAIAAEAVPMADSKTLPNAMATPEGVARGTLTND